MLGAAEAVTLVAAAIWGAIIVGCIVIQIGKWAVGQVAHRVR